MTTSYVGTGTITKAEVLTSVNDKTKFEDTNIDDELLEVLMEISLRTDVLKGETSGTWVAGDAHVDLPADLLLIDTVVYDGEEIDPVTETEYYRESRPGYMQRGGELYVFPLPSGGESYEINYTKTHTVSADMVLYGELFRQCIVAGVTSKRFAAKQQFDAASYWEAKYEQKLTFLMENLPCRPCVTEMRQDFRE